MQNALVFFLNTTILDDPSDFMIFIGRFHPLVVHLPIGFLCLAGIAQGAAQWPKFRPLAPFLVYLWGLGALSAAAAVLFGYVLSLSADYDADTLFWHKWVGIAVFVFAALGYLIFKKYGGKQSPLKWGVLAVTMASMLYAGHLGGHLTHGSTYLLEYAPNPLRSLAGLPDKKEPRPQITTLDSAEVYLDVISPIMDRKCISCHNSDKKKGDLMLTSYSHMMNGGENGAVIVPAMVEESELFTRITLAEEHDDFMPPEGKRPLTEQEVALIEWWIEVGAPEDGFVPEYSPNKDVTAVLSQYLGLDKNTVLSRELAPPQQGTIDSLRKSGFIINRLMKDNYFLEANFSLSEKPIAQTDLELLAALKEHLIWLDLSATGVKDEHMKLVGQFENLVKLDLSGNPITDSEIKVLEQLSHLESLNLYNTQVAQGFISIVPKLTRLQTLYLWRTGVNDSLIRDLRAANKNLKIIYQRDLKR